jgi:hypothetical protein
VNCSPLYKDLLTAADEAPVEEITAYLSDELPYIWSDEYKKACPHFGDICIIRFGSFEYIYDDRTILEVEEKKLGLPKLESRIVAAFGISQRLNKKRDDYRLRGWLGKTNTYFGKEWDKGHFIAHSLGGSVDQAELNVFRQRRNLNRGWSKEGKLYRKMEDYCYNNPGSFCFHRPYYNNHTAYPYMCEFGVLTAEKNLWVEQFNNS